MAGSSRAQRFTYINIGEQCKSASLTVGISSGLAATTDAEIARGGQGRRIRLNC